MCPDLPICQVSANELNDLLKSLLRHMDVEDPAEAIRRITSCEWVASRVACGWHEKNGVIYFSVTSDGTTGQGWIERLEKKGFEVTTEAREVLLSSYFQPTTGVTSKIALVTGELFEKGDHKGFEIREPLEYAEAHGLQAPNIEVACLMRETVSDHEMSCRRIHIIQTMHQRINFKRPSSYPYNLGFGRHLSENGKELRSALYVLNGIPGSRAFDSCSFAFIEPSS